MSNISARYGSAAIAILIAGVIALALWGAVRTVSSGKMFHRHQKLSAPLPDALLTERASESLSCALRVPTVTGDTQAMAAFSDFVRNLYADTLKKLNAAFLPGGSILLRWRASDHTDVNPVLFCGHIDVVTPGDGWTYDPFSGAREDGVIRGRGALDGKNVVIALLEAVNGLMEQGYTPRRDLYFAFGHDEEAGGAEGAAMIAELLRKRGLFFDMVLDEGEYVTKSHMGSRQNPAALIGVGEKAGCNFRLTAEGPGGKSGIPPRHTVLGILAEAICRVEAAPPAGRVLPTVREYLRLSCPAMNPIYRFAVANLPFTKPLLFAQFRHRPDLTALLRSSLAPTQASASQAPTVLPTRAEAVINAHMLYGDTPEKLAGYLRSLLSDLPITVTCEQAHNPCALSPSSGEMYQLLCGLLQSVSARCCPVSRRFCQAVRTPGTTPT